MDDNIYNAAKMFNLSLMGEYKGFLSCSVSETISHKGPVCAVGLMAVPLTVSHLLKKRGKAVLSFPVCNCFKSLVRIRSPYRHSPQQSNSSSSRGVGLC